MIADELCGKTEWRMLINFNKTNRTTKGSFMYAEKTDYDDIEMSRTVTEYSQKKWI